LRSGWLAESMAAELTVMLVLHTSRPFWRRRPGRALLATMLIAAVTLALPYSPLAEPVGVVAVPAGDHRRVRGAYRVVPGKGS
jgi:Mg2+-importing ATPase